MLTLLRGLWSSRTQARVLLLAATTATAFQVSSRKNDHCAMARCEPVRASYDEVPTSLYTRMPLPTRSQTPTHAIHGALLRDGLIETYEVHKLTDKEGGKDAAFVVGTARLGSGVDGHLGIVHGGILALLIDDVLGFGFYALGVRMAFTANLNINYVQPVPANTTIKILCSLDKQEGRKLLWSVVVVDATAEDKVYCNATSLYIIPRQAYIESA